MLYEIFSTLNWLPKKLVCDVHDVVVWEFISLIMSLVSFLFLLNGQGWARTNDNSVNSRVLYLLSYMPI